jgi:hypothetical protein
MIEVEISLYHSYLLSFIILYLIVFLNCKNGKLINFEHRIDNNDLQAFIFKQKIMLFQEQ